MEQKAPLGMKRAGKMRVFSRPRFTLVVALLLLLTILAVLPLFGPGPNIIRLLFVTFVWVTVSVAWNILGGFGGQVSFGFAVFYGLGAFTAALAINGGVNPVLSFLLAGSVAAHGLERIEDRGGSGGRSTQSAQAKPRGKPRRTQRAISSSCSSSLLCASRKFRISENPLLCSK